MHSPLSRPELVGREPAPCTEDRPRPAGTEGTPAADSLRLRGRLASLYKGGVQLDRDCPQALDLAEELHALAHDTLFGSISALGGHRTETCWRKAFGGHDCCLTLIDLAYWANHPCEAPRRAAIRIVDRIKAVAEGRRPAGTLLERAADAVVAAAPLNRLAQGVLADGEFSEDDRRAVLAAVAEAQRELDAIKAHALRVGDGR